MEGLDSTPLLVAQTGAAFTDEGYDCPFVKVLTPVKSRTVVRSIETGIERALRDPEGEAPRSADRGVSAPDEEEVHAGPRAGKALPRAAVLDLVALRLGLRAAGNIDRRKSQGRCQ